jgi:hypothetical protein
VSASSLSRNWSFDRKLPISPLKRFGERKKPWMVSLRGDGAAQEAGGTGLATGAPRRVWSPRWRRAVGAFPAADSRADLPAGLSWNFPVYSDLM